MMSWWQRFWYNVRQAIPGFRNRSGWRGYDAVDDIVVDDPNDWRNRNNDHI